MIDVKRLPIDLRDEQVIDVRYDLRVIALHPRLRDGLPIDQFVLLVLGFDPVEELVDRHRRRGSGKGLDVYAPLLRQLRSR